MVGEEVLELSSEVSALQQGEGEIWPLTPNGYFRQRPHLSDLNRHLARARHGHPQRDRIVVLIGQCRNYGKYPGIGARILETIEQIEARS